MGDERSAGEDEEPVDAAKRRRVDRALPDLVKKLVETAVERGVERLADTPESLRNFVGELKLPKEVLQHLYSQVDDTKNGLYRVVAKELRDVLEHTKFADELAAVLTKLSFEIRMEVRFVPNPATSAAGERADDQAVEPAGDRRGIPRPQVSAQVSVKEQDKDGRRPVRRREDP